MTKAISLSLIALLCSTAVASATLPASEGSDAGHESIGVRIANILRRSGLPDPASVFLISMLPVVELRGAVPAGHLFGMNPLVIYAVAVAGNMVPMPFILLLLGPVSRFLMRFRLGKAFFEWLFARTRRKSGSIEKYETLGLTLFVAIPLPVTGGWTGAMAAFLMGMKFHHAMWSILLGVMIAGVIMTVLCMMGWLGAIIAGVVLLGVVLTSMAQWLKKEQGSAAIGRDLLPKKPGRKPKKEK